jgi:hypothetical protein
MLLTPEDEAKLQAQYPKGNNLESQVVVAKLFYGGWTWYLLNQDPEDTDYLWCLTKGHAVESGSVSLSELEAFRSKPLKLPVERDTYFTPKPAKEVWDALLRGEHI